MSPALTQHSYMHCFTNSHLPLELRLAFSQHLACTPLKTTSWGAVCHNIVCVGEHTLQYAVVMLPHASIARLSHALAQSGLEHTRTLQSQQAYANIAVDEVIIANCSTANFDSYKCMQFCSLIPMYHSM